jgi:hypothetical protein
MVWRAGWAGWWRWWWWWAVTPTVRYWTPREATPGLGPWVWALRGRLALSSIGRKALLFEASDEIPKGSGLIVVLKGWSHVCDFVMEEKRAILVKMTYLIDVLVQC